MTAKNKKIVWTEVLFQSSAFLTPALKMCLVKFLIESLDTLFRACTKIKQKERTLVHLSFTFWAKALRFFEVFCFWHKCQSYLNSGIRFIKMCSENIQKSFGFGYNLYAVQYNLVFLFLSLVFLSCGKSPEPINYGKDECEHCRMMITDNKYGAEILTDKGKVYKFDSIECLIEDALEKNMIGDVNQKFLVTDFSKPGELIDALGAFYVHNDNFRSPMGLNVSAFENESDISSFITANGGSKLSWLDVIELVKQSVM